MSVFLRGVKSDGSVDQHRTFEFVYQKQSGEIDIDEQTGEPITATLNLVTRDKQRSLRRKHTKRVASGGKMEEVTDDQAFMDDLVDYMIVDWKHVRADADGDEVLCTRAAKLATPDYLLTDMLKVAMQGQSLGDFFRTTQAVS